MKSNLGKLQDWVIKEAKEKGLVDIKFSPGEIGSTKEELSGAVLSFLNSKDDVRKNPIKEL